MPFTVIIAHAEGEESNAEYLAEPLRAVGYDVQHRGTVLVGRSITGACASVLATGAPVILCATIDALGTGWAHWVVNAANRYQNVRVFPVRMEEKAYVEALLPDSAIAEYWQNPSLAIKQLIEALGVHYPPNVGKDSEESGHDNLVGQEDVSNDRAPLTSKNISDLEEERLYALLDTPLASDLTAGITKGYSERTMSYLPRLEFLGWVIGGRPSVGAFLCLGKQDRFGGGVQASTLQMVNHNAPKRGGDDVGIKLAAGNLFELYEEGISWLTSGTVLRRGRSIGSSDGDEAEIPRIVLHECLVNALVHRDYSRIDLREQPTRIDVFTDRLEITSYGSLLNGIFIDQLNTPDTSLRPFRRNPVIAQIFQCMGLAELNASGIERIQLKAEAAKLRAPFYQADENTVSVKIFRPSIRMAVFVSSVQKEFAEERRTISDLLRTHPILKEHFEPFLFEELPAVAEKVESTVLSAVDRCDVFIALIGGECGSVGEYGKSVSEIEYNRATATRKTRLVFISGRSDSKRPPALASLVDRVRRETLVRRFDTAGELAEQVTTSLLSHLSESGVGPDSSLGDMSFDRSECTGAVIADLYAAVKGSTKRFVRLGLNEDDKPEDVLEALNLLTPGGVTLAGALLFHPSPQRFFPQAVVKCVNYTEIDVSGNILDLREIAGPVFDQIEAADSFVFSNLRVSVEISEQSGIRRETAEIPLMAVREVLMNAIAHRDYSSPASIQVSLFPDRLEVWNPGSLPEGMTISDLKRDHASVPKNPLLARVLYQAGYVEMIGRGIQAVINNCKEANLAEPDFQQRSKQFGVILWRDWLTDDRLTDLQINERQRLAIRHLKAHQRITNSEYQKITQTTKRTAMRDLQVLESLGLIERKGVARGTFYVIAKSISETDDAGH